jgi:hypothetical protein
MDGNLSSIVSIITRLRAGRPGYHSQQGLRFSACHRVRPAVELTHPPVQWVLAVIFSGVKRPGREADHSHTFSAEVNASSCRGA